MTFSGWPFNTAAPTPPSGVSQTPPASGAPSLAQFAAFGQFFIDEIVATVLILIGKALGGIPLVGQSAEAFLDSVATDLLNQASTALATANGASATATAAQTTATTANTTSNNILGMLTSFFTGGDTSGNPLTGLLSALENAFSGIDLSSPGSILTTIENLAGGIPVIGPLIDALLQALTGSTTTGGGGQTGLAAVFSDISGFLGGLFGAGSGSFDPVASAENMLASVLTPAGALSSSTQVPQHLLGNLNTGQTQMVPGVSVPVFNLLPDPSFSDASFISGGGVWTWDGTLDHTGSGGSIQTTGASIVRQAIGVPINTAPGQVTDMGVYVHWSGVAASAGNAIVLVASAFDANNDLIPDANRVVSGIASPPASSVGYSGADVVDGHPLAADTDDWVQLVGAYLAPAGTAYVRLTLEVESSVSAGFINFDDGLQSLRGPVDASLLGNVENITPLQPASVFGVQGITDLVNTFGHLLDGLGSAFHPTGSVSGIDFAGLFGLAQSSAQNGVAARDQANANTVVLGTRTNKATSAGINSTSEAMFTIGHFSSGGSVTTAALAAGNAVSQMVRVGEAATKGFVEFLASGTSVTSIFVNVYKVNPTTKARTALWSSANIATQIPTSLGYVKALIPGTSQPALAASDLLQIEIVNAGANALTLATKATGIPNHPTDFPTNYGCTRVIASTGGASPTSLTDGQVTYSGTVPYVNFGIANVPADFHPPEPHSYTAPGTYSLALPAWLIAGDVVDCVGIGGGGGGGGSITFTTGQGGAAAAWVASTLVVGTDIKIGSTLTIVVGAGGTGGGSFNDGVNGGATTITYVDPSNASHTITCSGGAYGGAGPAHNGANPNGSSGGLSPGNETFDNITYFGGAAVGTGSTGASPGGGGGAAFPYLGGADGGNGEVDILFEQTL